MLNFCTPLALGVTRNAYGSRKLAQHCRTHLGSHSLAPNFRFHGIARRAASIRATATNESAKATVDTEIIDDDDDTDEESANSITLREAGTELELEVEVSDEVQVDGKPYLLVAPVYDPITFARILLDGEVEAVVDFKPLIAAARAALAEDHMNIIEAAYVGMVLDDDIAKDLEMEAGMEEEDEPEEGEEDEDAVEVVAEFQVNGEDFVVARSVEPTYLVAFQNKKTEQYEAVQQEELARLSPLIEAEIAKRG